MARTFRRQRQAHPIAELNITNLVDLGFTLLIIFMMTASIIKDEHNIPVNLPQSGKSAQPNSSDKVETKAISVDAQGRFYIGEKKEAVSLAELRSTLRGYAAMRTPPVIRIRGDGGATYDKVYQVIDECQSVNLTKLKLDSQKTK